MQITTGQFVDESPAEAERDEVWRYAYTLFRFSEATTTLVARSYTDEADAVCFIAIEQGENRRGLTPQDLSHPLMEKAIIHLRHLGKTQYHWLGAHGITPIRLPPPDQDASHS